MKLKFYKTLSGRWFLEHEEYLKQGGTIDDLEMVLGADEFLDNICTESICYIDVQTEKFKGWDLKLEITSNRLQTGAYYTWGSYVIWLCDVVKYLFDDFPGSFYIKLLTKDQFEMEPNFNLNQNHDNN